MDWKWFVVGAMAAVAVFFVVKYCMLRRNIKEFAAQMEECLDQVIVGDTVEPEKMQDTLFAKLQEKLYRVESSIDFTESSFLEKGISSV